jgi:eukaryotic-like serine/threonine-protein kinase
MNTDETKDQPRKPDPAMDMPAFGPAKKSGELGTLGKYRILKELGRGGMGGIYLGYDERLKRRTAIKVMLPKFAENPSAKERFNREALAAAQIKHDNIVVIYDCDEWNNIPYIAMEYLVGASLDDFLKKNPVTGISQALRVGKEICSALGVAHKMGVAHRDIKPSNIWLEAPLGKAKVLDFGLVKWLNPLDEAKLTTSGAIIGSPAYMSPEQARGGKIDHRTDIFSMGAVMYRMVTGQLPFQGDNLMDLLMALGGKEPTPILQINPKVPEVLAQLIHKMLEKNPDNRPQKAEDIAAEMAKIADKRQAGQSNFNLHNKGEAMRSTAPVAYTTSGTAVVAPIQVAPQEESAFDHLEESDPNARSRMGGATLPGVPAREATTISGGPTHEATRLPLVVAPKPPLQNPKVLIGAIVLLVFALTVVAVKLLR